MAVAEGKSFEFVGVENIQTELLETFEFDSPNQYICIESAEFSAVWAARGITWND